MKSENQKVNDASDDDDKIDIEPIVGEVLFSMKYGDKDCEYDRVFDMFNHVDYVKNLFEDNKEYLNRDAWKNIPNIEAAARQVLFEANELENRLISCAENSMKGEVPDLDKLFEYIGGKEFADVYQYTPMKAYGKGRPALLRLYAIKLAPNTYVITGGGIKLHDSIESSPGIKDHVLQDIRRARNWLFNSKILY